MRECGCDDGGDGTRFEQMLVDIMLGVAERLPSAARWAQAPVACEDGGGLLTMPSMDELRFCLDALLHTRTSEGYDSDNAVAQAALQAVAGALAVALGSGVDLGRLQAALDDWSSATGGPSISVTRIAEIAATGSPEFTLTTEKSQHRDTQTHHAEDEVAAW